MEHIVGARVKAARQLKGLSQEYIAEQTGLPLDRIRSIEEGGIQAVTNEDMWKLARAIECYIEDILDMTSSHSEKEILKGCVALLQSMVESFTEYLDYIGVDEDCEPFEESWSYFTIVQALFLNGTYHSGGTSTRMKCRELGVEAGDCVEFSCSRDKEDEE